MRYIKDEDIIQIRVSEFVSIARRKMSPTLPLDENEPRGKKLGKYPIAHLDIGERADAYLNYCHDGMKFKIVGSIDGIKDGTVSVVSVSSAASGSQRKAERSQQRGETFILARMLLEADSSKNEVDLRTIIIDEKTGESDTTEETVSRRALDSFLKKCIKAVSVYALPEIERVTVRLPSFEKMKFPYPDIRDGQREFIKHAYRAMVKSNTLFACAPTGTGKTISVIYPALKALASEKCDKVFYLTPKSTTARAARDCIEMLAAEGVRVRAIILTSKEKSCTEGLVCREASALCSMGNINNIADAVMSVYGRNKAVIDINDIRDTAKAYTVCPYELELAYSELCDIVICDFNYLFDPVVYIRRFFDEGGRFAFLIDEAHNLAERGREMYSASFSTSDIDALLMCDALGALSKLRKSLPITRNMLEETLYPYLKDEIIKTDKGEQGAVHLTTVPSELFGLIDEMISNLEDETEIALMARDSEASQRLRAIRELLYKAKKLSNAMAEFDTGYRFFVFWDNGLLTFKVFCIDTGYEIAKRLKKGASAVFFSATLTPLPYYRSILSDARFSDALEVDSPFSANQLSVSIMDKISTRYSEREKTLPAISRVIAATMSAKRGHYMVFTPSFEYAEEIHRHFSAKYPKIKCLLQKRELSAEEKKDFIDEFSNNTDEYLLGFCVMGGIYSEGIDLVGDSLIGAVVVGIGMPSLSYEREAIAEYFEDKYESGKQFAYIYPGMNRVFQAAGRVIRHEDDRGVIVLIDDRFADPIYKKSIPSLWKEMQYIGDAKDLNSRLIEFWKNNK